MHFHDPNRIHEKHFILLEKGLAEYNFKLSESTSTIDQRGIANAWGVSRLVFPDTLKNLQ